MATACAVVIVAFSACSSDGDAAGAIGYNAYLAASGQERVGLCRTFLGSSEGIAKRLDLDVELFEEFEPSGCAYRSQANDIVFFSISEDRPDQTLAFGKGETYYLGMWAVAPDGKRVLLDERARKDLSDWLQGRAQAIEDDYEEWYAGLTTLDTDFVAGGDEYAADAEYAADEDAGGTQASAERKRATLRTPAGSINVDAAGQGPDFLGSRTDARRPPPGHKILATSVELVFPDATSGEWYESAAGFEELPTPATEVTVEVNGVLHERATGLVSGFPIKGGAAPLILVVPDDVDDVALVATTGEFAQRVSLLTGEIDDDGFTERYESAHKADVAYGSVDEPRVRWPDGSAFQVEPNLWPPSYGSVMRWRYSPWHSWLQRPAAQDAMYFAVQLMPESPEKAEPLRASDMTAEVDGVRYQAVDFDAGSYVYTFELPRGAHQADVELRTTIKVAQHKDSLWYRPGVRVIEQPVNRWSVSLAR